MLKVKKVYYHLKGQLNCTLAYETEDSVKQIKSDIYANDCVLDAIKYEDGRITMYSKNNTLDDYRCN